MSSKDICKNFKRLLVDMSMSMSHVKIGEFKFFYQKTPYILGVSASKMIEKFGNYFHHIEFTPPFVSHP